MCTGEIGIDPKLLELQKLIERVKNEIEWSEYWLGKARETLDDVSETYFKGYIEGMSWTFRELKKFLEKKDVEEIWSPIWEEEEGVRWEHTE
ncbi:MAG: hypothetical protein DRN14_04085 [Thermoplasmata archaeon]|nr:MAG: hypothetical protein DRN14_04085 [Thermoplasmata archaeon]